MSFPSRSADGTVHLLSKKSRKLLRDTFFFMPDMRGWLIGGLNQRVTPVTSAKLHRWARMLDPWEQAFELQPVSIQKCGGVLSYVRVPRGAGVPAESTAPLAPGDYVWEVIDNSPTAPFNHIADAETFAELKLGAEQPGRLAHLKEQLHWYGFPRSLEQAVTQRDGNRCLITGSRSDIAVSWIFPPPWVKLLMSSKYSENHSAISNPFNAMLMRKDLIAAFHDNAFGIDVDDGHRLVMFRDIGPARNLLTASNSQAYFRRPRSLSLTGPDDYFLCEHFKHCLRVHLLHGDIKDDYPQKVVVQAMTDLGLMEPEDEMASLDDPRWNTELGKEILEAHLRSQIARSGYESPPEQENE